MNKTNPQPIPLQDIITKSYKTSFLNFWYFLQIAWLGYVIIFINNIIAFSLKNSFFEIIFFVINLYIISSIAVAWHRKVILKETVQKAYYIRADDVVWGYFTFGFLLNLPFVFILLIMALGGKSNGVLFLLWLLVMAAYIVVARISIGLPGKALSWQGIPLQNIWDTTRNNTVSIIFGYIGCTVPIILAVYIVSIFSFGVLALPAIFVGTLFMTMNNLSFMTYTFMELFEPGKDAQGSS